MLRRFIIAIITIAALGISFGTLEAFARDGHGGDWHGGGWYVGGGWNLCPWRWGFYGYPRNSPDTDCYRTISVRTPYGPGWRRVWVCG